MKKGLIEINEIIDVCERMIQQINTQGSISSSNSSSNIYIEYKKKLNNFIDNYNIEKSSAIDICEIYTNINRYYWRSNYSINLEEAQYIYHYIVHLKHILFPNDFDHIFISHREKDKAQIDAFVSLLYAIGIPRPIKNGDNVIYCTSLPAYYIDNGSNFAEDIKDFINCHYHTYYILWYTDEYFESQPCLNEVGAIWVQDKPYQEIVSPKLDCDRIGGFLNRQNLYFCSNDKNRLNIFKEKIEQMFDLPQVNINYWEQERDKYINIINGIYGL